MTLLLIGSSAAAQDVGYRDFTYPKNTGGNSRPTGEKPESKLWFNDGRWWGILWRKNPAPNVSGYTINYLNEAKDGWVDTSAGGVDTSKVVDSRLNSRVDVLSDGTRLYVASHVFTDKGGTPSTNDANFGRLYRFTYTPSGTPGVPGLYALDAGFPKFVTGGTSETLVLAKDSNGTLWVAYVESHQVRVNRSLDGGENWEGSFALPGADNLGTDDIASIIAYDGRVGILWSRQTYNNLDQPTSDPSPHSGGRDCANSSKANTDDCEPRTADDTLHLASITMNFAVHDDANANALAWSSETIYTSSGDDHINLKAYDGFVYAAFKEAGNAQVIGVLACNSRITACAQKTDWTHYTVYKTGDNDGNGAPADVKADSYPNPTRPTLLIDTANRELYVFVSVEQFDPSINDSRSTINYKKTSLDNISFDPKDPGLLFIKTGQDLSIDDPTSTKDNVNGGTDLVVLACDRDSKIYLHNYLDLK
jgi:hypothetical protein